MYSGTLIFDIESHSADMLYTLPPEEMVRLIGYKWAGDSEVTLTTDLEELREQIHQARWIIGHNVHAFDLPVVFGHRSNIPLQLAQEKRVYDTFIHAALVHPAPVMYIDRNGKQAKADTPRAMRKWFGLDEQAHQLGVAGKTHDLKALANEFGGFGEIPVDDERFREYLKGDVLASEGLARKLLDLGPLDAYALREQEIAARAAVISSNGFRVDAEAAKARRDELAARREVIMAELSERYGFPTEGKSPWSTEAGKCAILDTLADYGITPESHQWPETPVAAKRLDELAKVSAKVKDLRSKVIGWRAELDSGSLKPRSVTARERWIKEAEEAAAELEANPLPRSFGLSFSGEALIELTKGTEAAEIGEALSELMGQRSLSQLALDSMHSDGFAHPSITMLQRSGRWSTTDPGLTIWTSRGGGAVEKAYFIPDNPDEVLLEIDYSNADARAVAAMSGDKKFAERFEPDADGHLINAWAAWGKEVVGTDKHNPVTAEYRFKAKALGHGWNYGGQAKTLSAQSGVPLADAKRFCQGMAKTYHVLVGWQDQVRKEAQQGFVVNEWGRKMWVEKGREFTQAPALIGQSTTREIVCDALLAMPTPILRRVKAQIHDALLFSVPKEYFGFYRDRLVNIMESRLSPKSHRSQTIEFPVEAGPPGDNWYLAAHG